MKEITNIYGSKCIGRYFEFENDMEVNIILEHVKSGDYRHILGSNKFITSIPTYVLSAIKGNPNTILVNKNTNADNRTRICHNCSSIIIGCGLQYGDYNKFFLAINATIGDIKSDLKITNIKLCSKCF